MGLPEKNKSDRTGDDLGHTKKVTSYVKRHLGQDPKDNVENSEWRYSLINFSNSTHRAA